MAKEELKLNNISNIENVIEIKKEQKIKQEFIGSISIKRGHKLFEIDTVSKTVELAKFDTETAVKFSDYTGDVPKATKKKLTVREGCIYIPALNKKNAIKIFIRDYIRPRKNN